MTRSFALWDEGLAGKALSARPTSPRLNTNFPTAPGHRATVGFPIQFGISTSSGKSPVFVKGTHAVGCVSVRVQAAVWLGIVWAPSSGSRHSQATAVRLTDRGLVFPHSKAAWSEGIVSVLPACMPPFGPLQASCLQVPKTSLVIGPGAHVHGSRAELYL